MGVVYPPKPHVYAHHTTWHLLTLSIKLIDIGFSNNGVMLPRGAAAGTNTTGSDDEVLAIGDDLLAFIDFAPARTLSSSFLPLDQPGDVVTYLYNRGNNSELIFSNSYGAGTQLAAIGQHRGVTRSGSWESVLDSWPVDLNDVNTEFTVHSLFKLTSLSFTYLWDVGYQKILIWGQQLAFEDANGAKTGVLSIIPHVDYMLTVSRTNTNNGAHIDWSASTTTPSLRQLPLQVSPRHRMLTDSHGALGTHQLIFHIYKAVGFCTTAQMPHTKPHANNGSRIPMLGLPLPPRTVHHRRLPMLNGF